MTRQIITAIKTATRFKHAPLNQYLLVQPHAGGPGVRRRVHPRRRAARPGDESYEKFPFYAAVGVRELLVIDRDTKEPELYRPHRWRIPNL